MKMISTKGSARARLFASTLLAGLATVAAPLAVTTIATAVPTLASAQDYTSGTLTGSVVDGNGAPIGGATVTVKSLDQGFSRNLTTDSTGQFRAPLIPGGGYSVAISKEGFAPTSDGNVRVGVGGTSAYTFTLNPADAAVSEVVVTATANPQLDFSQSTKGISIDVETLQKQVPLPRDIQGIALLAPGVVSAVSGPNGFTNTDGSSVPSIGGASAGENAFYINGLNITNFNTYVGGATVPFDFYKSVDVKTGGYPAEFGRATGGVINAVTKSGTNDFRVALHGNLLLKDLQASSPNNYVSNGNRASTDNKQYTLEVGGPIIKDRLFAYGLYQTNDLTQTSTSNLNGGYYVDRSSDPFYGFKLDGYLTDRQHFEYTQFSTAQTISRRTYDYNASTDVVGNELVGTTYKNGGLNYVAKYTGAFTDWFTLSAAYGKNKDEDYILPASASASYVQDGRGPAYTGQAIGTYVRVGPTPAANATSDFANTERTFYRVDGDLYFKLLGDHHVRGGYDHEKTELFHASTRSGGAQYRYQIVGSAATATRLGLPLNQQYVRVRVGNFGGAAVDGENESFYLQDSWDVTDRLNLQIGARNDIFKLDNLRGERVLNMKNNWSPRFAFSYDLTGDGQSKVFASYGRYYIPPASNLSFRGADLYYDAYFLPPSGLDFTPFMSATAIPTLGAQINTATFNGAVGGTACPTGAPFVKATSGCVVYGNGTQEPAASKAAVGLKASYEDEFILGYERKLDALWKVGASLTYRNLGRVSEDIAMDSAILTWCARNPTVNGCGAADLGDVFYGDADYVVANPGKDTTIIVRTDLATPLAGQKITLSAADIGNPEAKREYTALELSFSRAFDGKWSLNGSYTLSELKGNYEGTVKSDAGNNAQSDAGSTQDFDHVGLSDFTYGLLPNHRGHQFKLFGAYAITDNLQVGGNFQLASPRHYSCIGVHPTDAAAAGYGSASRYCWDGAKSVAVPRGSAFKGDWYTNLDLQVRYTVPELSFVPKGLTLRADIFNLLNEDNATQFSEVGDASAGVHDANFGKVTQYQNPRTVRLGFDLEF